MLTLACPDRPGIVHAVTSFLMRHGGNIMESQQFGDQLSGRFFMRIDFEVERRSTPRRCAPTSRATAAEFGMDFELWSAAAPYRTLIMVSKQLHCLNDLLFRTSTGDLQIEMPAVVSNHPDAEALVKSYGIPFHHIPVTPETKADAEAELMRLVDDLGIHLVVLARYMQVLSDDACRRLSGRAINIHHSFLPTLQGRPPLPPGLRPRRQARRRHRPLRHPRPRRGPDHRAGRHPRRPHPHPSSSSPPAATSRPRCSRVRSRWHAQTRVLLNGDRTVVFR